MDFNTLYPATYEECQLLEKKTSENGKSQLAFTVAGKMKEAEPQGSFQSCPLPTFRIKAYWEEWNIRDVLLE